MSTNRSTLLLDRTTHILGFAIGLCGAFAILGVFFKIIEGPYYQTFMYLGFIGEAIAFVVMGFLELGQAFTASTSSNAEEAPAPPNRSRLSETETHEVARSMMQEQVSDDLNTMLNSLGKEVKGFGVEIAQMAEEMNDTRAALHDLRTKLDEVSSGQLAEDADQLGRGMSTLGEEMEDAGTTVETMREDLNQMLSRLRRFNNPEHSTNGTAASMTDGPSSH